MADKKVEFEIKVIGDAVERLRQITGQAEELGRTADVVKSRLTAIGGAFVAANQALEFIKKGIDKMREYTDANRAQQEAEAKLAQVMRNTMGASNAEIASIKDLASAQQQLGVIGDEVQLAGAQELGTYLSKADSIRKLMPVMNDMLAQQYGLNASQEQATQIASMMGKVMEGQVGALSRYGYKFDEAQEKLLKYGSEEERVATLAEVIGQSVGGMNEALAMTPEGKIQQVANSMGDVKERVGAIWVQIQTKLLPVMEGLVAIANGLIDVVQKGWPVWVGAAAAVLVAVTKVHNKLQGTSLAALLTGGSFTTMGAMAKAACQGIGTAIKGIPIVGWVAGAATLIVGLFRLLWKKSEEFRAFWGRLLDGAIRKINKLTGWINKVTGLRIKGIAEKGYEGRLRERGKNGAATPDGMAMVGEMMAGSEGLGLGEAAQSRAARGAEAAVTGGTRNTTVNINLGKMVENIVFDGTLGEHEQELESKIQEILTRTLMMAVACE